jgi:phosphomannomutase
MRPCRRRRCARRADRVERVPRPRPRAAEGEMRTPVMVDLRNIYEPGGDGAAGFAYTGRPPRRLAPSARVASPRRGHDPLAAHVFDPTILREYDIRGIVGETLTGRRLRAIGRAFGTIVARRRGGRPGGGRLRRPAELARARGGPGRRPRRERCRRAAHRPRADADALLRRHDPGADGGIMVTGSHNPPDYNGFKMMLGKESFFGERHPGARPHRRRRRLESGAGRSHGRSSIAYVARSRRLSRGAGARRSPGTPATARRRGHGGPDRAPARPPQLLNAEIDGTLSQPPPGPDGGREPRQLIETVREGAATSASPSTATATGSAWSTARAGSSGATRSCRSWPRRAEAPARRHHHRRRQASQVLFDHIAAKGGKPLMWKTGHSLIKAKMVETGAPLAGEMSGHIFYIADGFYGHDDALYARSACSTSSPGAKRPWRAQGRDAAALQHARAPLRLPRDAEVRPVIEAVQARLAAQGAEVDATDGVRVKQGDGWWLLRASNTQAVLVGRADRDRLRPRPAVPRLRVPAAQCLGRGTRSAAIASTSRRSSSAPARRCATTAWPDGWCCASSTAIASMAPHLCRLDGAGGQRARGRGRPRRPGTAASLAAGPAQLQPVGPARPGHRQGGGKSRCWSTGWSSCAPPARSNARAPPSAGSTSGLTISRSARRPGCRAGPPRAPDRRRADHRQHRQAPAPAASWPVGQAAVDLLTLARVVRDPEMPLYL